MCRIELSDNLISLYKNEKCMYTFNWESLEKIWNYATMDDVERITADYSDGLLSVILTTAQGQGGIIAVIDIENNKLIHHHDGSFAIKTLITDNKIITLYHIVCYGKTPEYYVDCLNLNERGMMEMTDSIKLPKNVDFNDEDIGLTLIGGTLTIEDGKNAEDVDISALIYNGDN